MFTKLLVLGSVALLLVEPAVPQAPIGFTLTVSPPDQTVKIGEPIKIAVTLRNAGQQDLRIDADKSRDASLVYGFDVLNANGNHLCMTEAYAASRDHKGDCLNPKSSSKVFVTVKSFSTFH